MSALKPCPFCGSDNIVEQDPGMGVHYVLCLHCHAQGPISFSPETQWNNRKVSSELANLRDLNAKLVEALEDADCKNCPNSSVLAEAKAVLG